MATKEEILAELNPEQQSAVTDYEGSMVVEAPPGSGKTHTIVSRCQYMILDGVKPGSILVFTFTRKAANELRERIQAAVGEQSAKAMTIATYHSFCGQLLRKFPELSGRNKNFTIYDEDDKKNVLDPICKQFDNFKYAQARNYISQFKMNGIKSSDAVKTKYSDSFQTIAAKIYEQYDRVMVRCNAFDFDDLPLHAYLLLKNSHDALNYVHNKYKYIISDENQDSSRQNIEFALMLRGENGNLCVCGDTDQSIYGFRGADVISVLKATSGSEFKRVYLKTNYRSTQAIVNASLGVISKNMMRVPKQTDTINEVGKTITIMHALNDSTESRAIAMEIAHLHDAYEVPYKDIAILCRVQRSTRALENALMGEKVPYSLKGLVPFYSRREIKDIVAYLRLLLNSNDEEAFRRIVNIPKHGVGATTIKKIIEANRKNTKAERDLVNIYESLSLSYKIKAGLDEFKNNFNDIKEYYKTYPEINDLIEYIIDKVSYKNYLQSESDNDTDYNERLWNIEELQDISAGYTSIEDFIQNFIVDPDTSKIEEDVEEDPDRVNIMTMHSSKGLEFRVVFLYEVNEDVIPHIKSANTQQGIEEERRLFYVAMTRAKKELYIAYADSRNQSDYKPVKAYPSRFINEIPAAYTKKRFV